eukprot:1411483-Pyramimonas_sp.AAC.1
MRDGVGFAGPVRSACCASSMKRLISSGIATPLQISTSSSLREMPRMPANVDAAELRSDVENQRP